MTIVRIVLADPRTGGPPGGSAVNGRQLIVLADDTGHRAVPLWLPGLDFKLLWWVLDRPARDAVLAGVLEETAAGLLHAAGVAVTAVDIEPAGEDVPELRSGTAAARVELATAAGTRHVRVSAGYGLKLAVVAGAPVRVADAVMDRLAVPVHGQDVQAPFLLPSAVRPPGDPGQRQSFEPRNMAFTDGLDRWELAGSFLDAGRPHWQDYSRAAADRSAILASAVPEPSGSAVLFQEIYADDYRGRTVTFRGQLRTTGVAGQAGLHLAAGLPPALPANTCATAAAAAWPARAAATGPGMRSRCASPATLASSGSASRWPAAAASSCATRNCPRPGREPRSKQRMDISDGNLVRLARDGDPAAFRLLVERHLPMARARAARLCPQPDDADDAVQDAFLQAFTALDRLRDPDRFAGWLGGILANVCRAQRRRAPLTLLGDWPENLHPAAASNLPSAEDLDRADALGRAVAGLPPGQRHAVTLFYYADQPAGQIAGTPGAAKASLHKARRRLREYITAHRPDLIPATSRRTPMTAVRIAHADPWPERQPAGLVVLADDAGHRALPVRLPALAVWRLLARPDDRDQEHPEDDAGQMTGQLLHAAGITVTAVTVTDLGPAVTATRVDIAVPGGTRQVTTRLADGLALAVITGAPLAVDDPVMDRLAEAVTGPDPPGPFRSRQQAPPGPPEHTRFEPRNLAFTDGLHRWQLDGTFLRQAGFHHQDYSCTTQDGRVILAAAVPGPAGFAVLGQEIEPDDYRGRAVTFRGHLRTTDVADRAGLVLRIPRQGRRPAPSDPWHDPENHFALASGTRDWTRHQVTAQVPADAISITFGVFLNGRGQIELRNPQLDPHPANQ